MARIQHMWHYIGILVLVLLSYASAYKYLVVLPTAGRSHYNCGSALAKGLAAAGHQVTLVSGFPLKKPIENIEDIPLESIIKAMEMDLEDLLTEVGPVQQAIEMVDLGVRISEAILSDPVIVDLMASNRTYDAVISEIFLNEAQLGLAEHFKAPLIATSSFGAIAWNTDLVGSPSPPSYVPSPFLSYSDHMTFIQRITNFAYIGLEYYINNFIHLPLQEKLYKQYFPNNKQDFYDMRRNTALVLLNQHVSLSYPRPYSPNMIEVGGMHINRKTQPLPTDIEEFINGAEHGVIYFSMGSALRSKDLPADKRAAILQVFRGLKQRVLWKFESTDLPGKPDNVFIHHWFPQDDILAHKNVIAFITHGGLLSSTETIYHGKPIVGIPIFGDQFLNTAKAELNGFGVTVKYSELTADKLRSAIERIVNDPAPGKKARQMSAQYRDQQNTPLEKAVYWVEHVTRHNGARYLRSASQDLNFIQYHSLDVIFILLGGLILVFVLLVVLIIRAIRLVLGLSIGNRQPTKKKPKRS